MTAPPAVPAWKPLAAGLMTGVGGLAVSVLVTRMLHERVTAPTAVAEAVVEVTPGKLAVTLVHLVGTADKPLLRGGVVVVLLGLAALAGWLGRRSVLRGQAVFLVMGLIAAVAVQTRPGAGTGSTIPVVAGTVTWLALLPWLWGALTRSAGGEVSAEDRRAFVRRLAIVGVGAAVAGVASTIVGRSRRVVEEAISTLRLPVTRGRVPSGAELDVAGLSPWRTPNGEFYRIDTAFSVPTIDKSQWRLRVHGMVERELSLSYDDLLARDLTESWTTICCVSNEVGGDLIGNAWWSGVRIADVLREAGVKPGADAVLQTSEDGWSCGTPLDALTDDRNALLAIAMNGDPLPLEHGFPVRMIVPGLYGYVSATKWLVDLEVSTFEDVTAFWTERGWGEKGPVKTQSRIDVPGSNRRVDSGAVTVAGVAWAQHTGIEKVEVRVDGEDWQEVEVGGGPEDSWVQWRGTVDVVPGIHTLAVRATDRSGYTQTGVEQDVLPDGATGWHTIDITAE